VTSNPKATAAEWAVLFARELGTAAPSDEEVDDLLAIAGTAAHASERTAAPLSTWLVGRSGVTAAEAKAAASKLASKLAPRDGSGDGSGNGSGDGSGNGSGSR
jgi:hypothetical protein